jgi:hypothetical protein
MQWVISLALCVVLLASGVHSTSELESLRAANAQLLERLQHAQSELANCHGKLTGSKDAKDWVWHSARVRMPKATDGDEAAAPKEATDDLAQFIPIRETLKKQFPEESMQGELHILGLNNPEVSNKNFSSCRRMDTLLMSGTESMDGRCIAVLRSSEGRWAEDAYFIPYRMTTKKAWGKLIREPVPGSDAYKKWATKRMLEQAFSETPDLETHIDDLPLPKNVHSLPPKNIMYVTRPVDLDVRLHTSDYGKPTVFFPDPVSRLQKCSPCQVSVQTAF